MRLPVAGIAQHGRAAGRGDVLVDDADHVLALHHHLASLHPDHPVAGQLDLLQVVRDQEDGACLSAQLLDPGVALDPELRVAGRQRLVDQQHVLALGGGDGEPKPGAHAGGVGLHRQVDEVADAGEVHDALVLVLGLLLGHAHGQAAEDDVALAGEVVEQRGVDAEQRRLAGGVDVALLRRQQAGDGPQQRGLARAVAADHADGVAAVGHERDAADRVHLADRARGTCGRGTAAAPSPRCRGRRPRRRPCTRCAGRRRPPWAQPRPYLASARQKKKKPITAATTAQPIGVVPEVIRVGVGVAVGAVVLVLAGAPTLWPRVFQAWHKACVVRLAARRAQPLALISALRTSVM